MKQKAIVREDYLDEFLKNDVIVVKDNTALLRIMERAQYFGVKHIVSTDRTELHQRGAFDTDIQNFWMCVGENDVEVVCGAIEYHADKCKDVEE